MDNIYRKSITDREREREREKERKRDRQTERGDTERVKSIFGDLKVNIILTFIHLFLFWGVWAHLG